MVYREMCGPTRNSPLFNLLLLALAVELAIRVDGQMGIRLELQRLAETAAAVMDFPLSNNVEAAQVFVPRLCHVATRSPSSCSACPTPTGARFVWPVRAAFSRQ